ncbi:sugar phosphate nucleotidyltransferase [Caulobacter sp. NIBR2454]|uniref:sugar phosphate nucleotidyltransferase n=1 Tax=Caulobacter sp. NIBR2454 TaxID=3015996 RepID=UPI0022B660CF|nr:sugar phosphate nucleotidyltransferase [Caulobacter sp. NIBR2454]
MKQCVILAGGRGTRLGSLTDALPKPLQPVAGRPFMAHLFAKAANSGFTELVLLAGYRAEAIEAFAQEEVRRFPGLTVSLSVEPEPLGTAGALAHASDRLDPRFLLVNGDTWFDFDWRALRLGDGAMMAMALRHEPHADRYETAQLTGDRITALEPRDPARAGGLINGGVYAVDRRALADGESSLEQQTLPRLCREGRLAGARFDGAFIDIGVPESLAAAQALAFPEA